MVTHITYTCIDSNGTNCHLDLHWISFSALAELVLGKVVHQISE